MLRRKITRFLAEWKGREGHKPLIINGARQVGKTMAVLDFAERNYKNVVAINFALEEKFKTIFNDGFDVNTVLKNISMLRPDWKFEPRKTIIFFDEMQECPNCATSLKPFRIDGRYDVVCSGSMMGIHYKEITSNAVGYKEDYEMRSMDFEEFLWAKGYREEQIDELLQKMWRTEPLSALEMDVYGGLFRDYIVVGGMPEVVKRFVEQGNFSGILDMQKQLLRDYANDITKYAQGADRARITAVYNHIPVFLGKENKKFQISKVAKNARSRDYIGVTEWLRDAGIVNVCYCMEVPELPLKGNYLQDNYKLYYHDSGLLIASLDEEAQEDLRANKNFNTCKGAIYENVVAEALAKQGYGLYFYRNEKITIEMDFFVRDTEGLIPVEVKAKDGATISLRNLIEKDKYPDIKYGIKLCDKNIGFNGKFYSFPYFLCFLLRRYLMGKGRIEDRRG